MKNSIFLLILFSLVLSFSTVGFAAVTYTNASSGPANDGSLTAGSVVADFAVSKNVTLVALASADTYAAISSHLNGTKLYGSSADDSVIYVDTADKTSGTAYTSAPSSSDSGAFTGGNWSVK